MNKIDWTAELAKYADQPNIVPRVEYCRQHFLDQSASFETLNERIYPNWELTGITIGVMAATFIFTHLVLVLVTRFTKSEPKIEVKRQDSVYSDE